jgi:uncharacterized protein (DUF1015 family)
MKKLVKPLAGLRPNPAYVAQVIAPPYDVVDRSEAKRLAQDNPYSFLHISKPEINLADQVDEQDPQVYEAGQRYLQQLLHDGVLLRDESPAYYIYQLINGEHAQTGVLGTLSVEAYQTGKIAKHELTRPAKVTGRVKLTQALQTQISPVLLTYRDQDALAGWLADKTHAREPDYSVTDHEGVIHKLWVVKDADERDQLDALLQQISQMYIADGHHRCACAAEVLAQANHPANEYFLAAMFPASELEILSYHRIIRDLPDFDAATFVKQLGEVFTVERIEQPSVPADAQTLVMYTAGQWYRLHYPQMLPADPIARLPVTVLHDYIIEPMLGISDPRVDPRIDFCGGQRKLNEFAALVDAKQAHIFFGVAPTTIEQLLTVADQGEVMPPKSTWFTPKLVDGLVSYETLS